MSKKRWITEVIVGFLLGRVWIFGINPFAVAYICASGVYPGSRTMVLFASLVGVLSQARGIRFLQYLLVISLIGFVQYIMKKIDGKEGNIIAVAIISAILNFLIGATVTIVAKGNMQDMWLSLLESICMIALVNVFQWGLRFLLYEDWKKILSNEEMISVIALLMLAIYGLPRPLEGIFSVVETFNYLVVLFVGYRYGAAAGAMAGAAGGILAVVENGELALVGVYCLLGITVGIFREIGKGMSTIAFLVLGVILSIVVRNEVLGIVELRGMVSAVLIFAAIPGSILPTIENQLMKNQENPFAKEDVKMLANYKLDGFSAAFMRLAKSFRDFTKIEQEISEEEVEDIFEELSQKVCVDCVNCHYCWETNFEDTYANVQNILAAAREDGTVEPEHIGNKFMGRCLRIAEYVDKVNEKMSVARMNLSWRNQMAESREAMAAQMMEIAGTLKDFSVELNHTVEVPQETKKKVLFALRSLGIQVKDLTFQTNLHGRMEICFMAKARGNACVTHRDISQALESALERPMCPGKYVRNVIQKQYGAVAFTEDTNYKALTGIARATKSGEEVSGDNFSFMEVRTGELLMLLADGMGSGTLAYQDSENLVEVMECLMEAGFQKKSAVRLMNTLFVMSYEGKKFTTLDMASIDLYSGSCEIVKNGAVATFIRRNDRVETLCASSLPVGVEMHSEPDTIQTMLQDGDLVIMVSDGVVDAFPGEDKEFYIENILQNVTSSNPSDVANAVLMNAVSRNPAGTSDDMSVLVAGIWKRRNYVPGKSTKV